ncbi:hypothetical protein SDRG_16958 [Saprolegnia diclina VS20]|uniref:Uncharacterized protein n=1 Tax=Saprolegnia diclina (strain VS20) TaxID=1156394 RepID=T0R6N0_SAPDV|nr:hypothetical protein SDRG_16958 [Saprolegnia diclina VS20]EQC25167.1 hypothetical protein SDRG_16958 [Saprolegnia diclina VS20]|eukprot:XP_008621406.1 hypothetical protein SDRG_16958 [Saprolegnia diclina VS20]
MSFLDIGGQLIVIVVLLREFVRSSYWLVTHIPTVSRLHYDVMVDTFIGRRQATPTLNSGVATMSLSQIWLVNPWYLIGNCMYGIGTTAETQMLVEVLYYEWTISGGATYFIKGAMYAMRHAWVSIGVWTCIRFVVTTIRLPNGFNWPLQQLRLLEMYCSCRTLVFAFIVSSFVATRTRGQLYLTDRVNVVDQAHGLYKGSFTDSEDWQSLLVNHGLAIGFDVLLALLMRSLLSWTCPNHRDNSFFKVIDQHRVCAGFDLARLIAGSRSIVLDHRCVLLMPVADLYLIYASVNLWSTTAMVALPDAAHGHAIEFRTSDDGTMLLTNDAGVFVPALATLQNAGPSTVQYCAVV